MDMRARQKESGWDDVITINPLNMTPEENIFLKHMLSSRLLYSYNSDEFRISISNMIAKLEADTLYVIPWQYVPKNVYSSLEESKRFFKLSKTILRRSRESDKNAFRYEIVGERLGGGGYGTVYKILGTLAEDINGTLVLRTDISRVLKETKSEPVWCYISELEKRQLIQARKQLVEEIANNEHDMLDRDDDSGVKSPIFFSSDQQEFHSILISHYLEGRDLAEVINEDQKDKRENKNNMETDVRIDTAINILLAMKHVHALKIRHGDIKPENIKINLPSSTAKILDFGGSMDIASPNFTTTYTPRYASIIILTDKSIRNDLYSIGRCLIEILRADRHPVCKIEEKYLQKSLDYESRKKAIREKEKSGTNSHSNWQLVYQIDEKQATMQRKTEKKKGKKIESLAKHYKIKNLFKGINDLDKAHKKKIKQLLKSMLAPEKFPIVNLDEALQVFEEIDLDRRLKWKLVAGVQDEKMARTNFTHAHETGVKLRCELQRLFYENKRIDLDDIACILALINDSLDEIMDQPEIIQLFLARLKVQHFAGMTCKKEIIDKLTASRDLFLKYQTELAEMNLVAKKMQNTVLNILKAETHDQAVKEQLEHLNQMLNSMQDKSARAVAKNERHPSIDHLALTNIKYKKQLETLQNLLDFCQKQLTEIPEKMKHKEVDIKDKIINAIFQSGLFANPNSTSATTTLATDTRPTRNQGIID